MPLHEQIRIVCNSRARPIDNGCVSCVNNRATEIVKGSLIIRISEDSLI